MSQTPKQIRTQALETIQIGNRNYTEVATKINHVAKNFDYSVTTKEKFYPELRLWVVKATVTLFEEGKAFTYQGTAKEYENKIEGDVNSTSALENAETSAVGRALSMAGIGTSTGVASADEIRSVERAGGKLKQGNTKDRPKAAEGAEKEPQGSNFDKVEFLLTQIAKCETPERLNKMLDAFNKDTTHEEGAREILKTAFAKRKEALRKRDARAAAKNTAK